MTSSSLWQPKKSLRTILTKLCAQRGLNLQDYVIRDASSTVLDIDKSLEELDLDFVWAIRGVSERSIVSH